MPPYGHQAKILGETWNRKQFALFWEMGAGKSKPIIDTAAMLFLAGEIDGLWIVCDNGAYRNWTDYEIPRHMPPHVPTRTAYWASTMKSAEKRKVEQLLVAVDDVLDILVMPVEAFSATRAPIFAEAFLRSHYPMGVIDESSSIKNLKANRTGKILSLRNFCEYRRIMSGTPITNSPIDLFSQFEFLESGLLGFTSYVAFRNHYCKLMLMDAGRGKFLQIVGYKNLEELTQNIQPHSSRVLKVDCLDLPDKIYERCFVEHTAEQRLAYETLRSTAVMEMESGQVTVTSALTMLGKLHQINCGHVKDDDGMTRDIPNNRVSELLRLIELVDGKVIVWAYFVRDIELIRLALTAGNIRHVHYYGATSPDDRVKAINDFRNDPGIKVFLSNQQTGGKGISLTEASDVVYYSQSFSLTSRLQSEDRCHRPGQHRNVTYTDLVTANTVDIKICDALRDKKDLASSVLDVYRECLIGS
jgi:SNF2 family DNA or RNA helicase